MSTSDQPPHELRGPLGQLGSAGGGIVPVLAPAPIPNAIAYGSPGLATNAIASPLEPTLPSPDPTSMALLIAKLAGEAFGGSSVVPAPLTNNLSVIGGAPVSPGFGSGVVSSPMLPSGGPSDPAVPTSGAVPTSIAPVSPAPFTSSIGGMPSGGGAPASGSHDPGGGRRASEHDRSSSVRPASRSVDSSLSPFSMSSFDSLAAFDFGDMRLPMLDGSSTDLPGYTPNPDAIGLDTQPANSEPMPHEVRTDDSLIRNLGGAAFDPYAVRRDFPILDERVHGKRLVWLDNAATTQKPRVVIDRLSHFYEHENSNIHRAAHTLAARATDAYEGGRESTRKLLNASSTSEIIFVRGATEGINLVAQSWGRRNVGKGDEIVLTHLEHHANIVPWQQLCAEKGARLRIAPVDDRGDVILEEYERLLGPRTRLVAFPQVSNALGTITPAREMVEIAHRYGAHVLVDGAQAVSHMRVDVQQLDCDFYVFSGHKVFAPTGIGAVFGKREILEAMPPWQGGGNMIQDVTFEKTSYQPPPFRFEAGTGSIADAAGLGTALEYVMKIGLDVIDRYEHDLLVYATERLATVPGLKMIGTSPNKAGVMSFVLDGHRTEDVGAALDQEGIAVRSGHHCAQPILRRFGVEATIRASLAFYNVCEDIDALVEALLRLQSGR